MPSQMTELKDVDTSRPRGRLSRWLLALATSRPGLFLSRHISWKLDPVLLRITGGRLSTTLFIRTAVLETRGAKSGKVRRNAVIYFPDGDRVTIVPSNAGARQNPAWFHNLVAHPDVTLNASPMRALVISDESERKRLWEIADRVFPPFERFRQMAATLGRAIPIVQLERRP